MWATLSTGEHFYKNIRENTTNTNRRRNWIAPGDGSEKPSATESFIFPGIVGPKSLRVIFGEPTLPSPPPPLRTFLLSWISINDLGIVLRVLVYSLRLIISREWTVNSAAPRRQFSLRESILRDTAERSTNTAQLTCLKMDLRQPPGRYSG